MFACSFCNSLHCDSEKKDDEDEEEDDCGDGEEYNSVHGSEFDEVFKVPKEKWAKLGYAFSSPSFKLLPLLQPVT